MNDKPFRLTDLAHGGGCGCKLAPSVLQDLLADQAAIKPYRELLVGNEHGDDAAVWQVDEKTCVIATTDFFMPVVDDPYDFGRIAATNAVSDVYAMGGKPILAIAILGIPVGKIPTEAVREILRGGSDVCAAAGFPVAGGHSIDCPEPIYGLAVIGLCTPEEVRRNSTARPGDVLILTKGVGVGVYSAAFKKSVLPADAYDEMIASTTQMNAIGATLSKNDAVHAITDVTGFGVLGHAFEVAKAASLAIEIDADAIPLLNNAAALVKDGFITGASHRNWESFGAHMQLPAAFPDWRRHLLTDPQTSGGLLVACAPDAAEEVLAEIKAAGFHRAAIIGRTRAGPAGISVKAG